MKEPIWLQKDFLLVIHDELLSLYGGSAGVRDEGLLESALGKPLNLFHYERADIFALAAAYAAGIIHNHPFIDGNKRTGFMAAYTFLGRNGHQLMASEADATVNTIALAAGQTDQAAYTAWLKRSSEPIGEAAKQQASKSTKRTATRKGPRSTRKGG